jgi:hypothetical protein
MATANISNSEHFQNSLSSYESTFILPGFRFGVRVYPWGAVDVKPMYLLRFFHESLYRDKFMYAPDGEGRMHPKGSSLPDILDMRG